MKKELAHLPSRGLFAAATVVVSLFAAVPTTAAADDPDFTYDLPMGVGCPSFDLRIEGFIDDARVFRTFYDKSGNPVRWFAGGKGNLLRFTNLNTGASFSIRTGGSVERSVLNSDGSLTYTVTGHNVVSLFPTDVPAGPSTKLYLGRVVFNVDAEFTFTMLSSAGKEVDLCAALN